MRRAIGFGATPRTTSDKLDRYLGGGVVPLNSFPFDFLGTRKEREFISSLFRSFPSSPSEYTLYDVCFRSNEPTWVVRDVSAGVLRIRPSRCRGFTCILPCKHIPTPKKTGRTVSGTRINQTSQSSSPLIASQSNSCASISSWSSSRALGGGFHAQLACLELLVADLEDLWRVEGVSVSEDEEEEEGEEDGDRAMAGGRKLG